MSPAGLRARSARRRWRALLSGGRAAPSYSHKSARASFEYAAEGGAPTSVTHVDRAKRELSHLWPEFLPDGRHFLYLAMLVNADGVQATPHLYAASLDSPEITLVAQMYARAVFAPPDHLLFVQDGALQAQASIRRRSGSPVSRCELPTRSGTIERWAMAHSRRPAAASSRIWVAARRSRSAGANRDGTASESNWQTENLGSVQISPDGQRAAVDIADPRIGTADVWIYDTARGAPVRLTTDLTNQSQPVWSPDGRRICLIRTPGRWSPKPLREEIGTGAQETLLLEPGSTAVPLSPEDWSRDGQWIAYFRGPRQRADDLWLLPLSGDRQPIAFASERFSEGVRVLARFEMGGVASLLNQALRKSTSHRWRSRATGTYLGRRRQHPTVAGDGRELFYAAADNRSVMAVAVMVLALRCWHTEASLYNRADAGRRATAGETSCTSVTPDGARFLVSIPSGQPSSSRVTVVLNWAAALRP